MGVLFFIICVALVLCSAWLFFRLGWWSLLAFVPFAVYPVFTQGFKGDLSVFIAPAVFGISGGYCFRRGLGLDFFITVSALAFTLLFTADYLFLKNFRGYDMVKAGMDEMAMMLESSKAGIDQLAVQYNTPKEEVEKIRADIETMIATMKDSKWIQMARDIIPFSAFLLAVAIAGTSFFLMTKITMKKASALVKPLQYFRLNDYFIFALIAGIAGLLLVKHEANPVLYVISLNMVLMVSVLYAIQALGIIKHLFIRRNIPVFILPLVILILTALSPVSVMFLMIIFTGIGSLDLWADFRKLGPDTTKK